MGNDSELNLYAQAILDISALALFDCIGYRMLLMMSKDGDCMVWMVITHYCKCIAYRVTYCCRNKSEYAIAHERNIRYEQIKCPVCWDNSKLIPLSIYCTAVIDSVHSVLISLNYQMMTGLVTNVLNVEPFTIDIQSGSTNTRITC